MDGMTDEQRMLQDSLDSILQGGHDQAEIWSQLAASGMLGLTLPENAGGAELGLAELLIFAHRFGQACVTTPYLASEVLALPLLAQLSDHPRVAPLLASLTDGARIATFASDDLEPVLARKLSDGTYELEGVKMLVPAAYADVVVLTAELDGEPVLFLVERGTDKVTFTTYTSTDPNLSGDIRLGKAVLSDTALLAQGETAVRLIADAQARGSLAICADMLGGMEMLLEVTLDYLRTRQQFGQTLASFQTLQHAAVDMYVELETARAMLGYGVRMFGANEDDRSHAIDAVKIKMNSAAKIIGENAVQLHGGIGMTMESLTGRLFARLTAQRFAFGDTRQCLQRLMFNDASVALS